MRPYIKDYVKTYIGHSITTTQWKDHLYSFFASQEDKIKALDSIDWNVSVSMSSPVQRHNNAQTWFYGEGVTLPVKMEYDLTLVTAAYDLADRWNASRNVDDPSQLDFEPSDLEALGSNQRSGLLALCISVSVDDGAYSGVPGTSPDLPGTPREPPISPGRAVQVLSDD